MGLKNNDLKDTLANLISVDEFESKTGAPYEIIVVAFHVIDELPAQDLSDFLEKSFIDIVDAEKSPNPNDKGHYLVFVEIKRNAEFFDNLHAIIKEVERLSGPVDWKISPYLDDNIYNYKEQYWKNFVITNPSEYISKDDYLSSKQIQTEPQVEEDAKEFFKESGALEIVQEGKDIKIFGQTSSVTLSIVGWHDELDLMENETFKSIPFALNERRIELTRLKGILGPNWDIYSHDNRAVICRKDSHKVLYADLA